MLACGALLKNTFCIGTGDAAYLGPHIGDLENLETYRVVRSSRSRGWSDSSASQPEIVAHDLHPDYMSTTYALARSEPTEDRACSIITPTSPARWPSTGSTGPVIGVAYDGTGYGTDGTAWGGEVLVARYETFERVATFRPVPLAGGDAAIRHPWRIALALVDDAFEGDAPLDASAAVFDACRPRDVGVVRQMIADAACDRRWRTASGRYFDGIGALVLGAPRRTLRGADRARVERALPSPAETRPLRLRDRLRGQSPWTIDLRPMVREVVRRLLTGGTRRPRSSRRAFTTRSSRRPRPWSVRAAAATWSASGRA